MLLTTWLVLMWIGFQWSRGLLSLSMMGCLLTVWLSGRLKECIIELKQQIDLLLLPFFFVFTLLSGVWSSDWEGWWQAVQIKIPFLIWPILIVATGTLERRHRQVLVLVLSGLTLFASWPTWAAYFDHPVETGQSYLRASVLPVAADNDHVRFGWALGLLTLLICDTFFRSRGDITRFVRIYLAIALIFLTIFIHLLGSKTGLAGFYLTLAGIVFITVRQNRRIGFRWLAALIFIPLIAWWTLPTFQNRLKFILWDYQHYTRGQYREGLTDAPRWVSMQAASAISFNAPWTGVGAGDLKTEMLSWYERHATYLKDYERLRLPSNQYLVYAAATGIPAAICILAITLLPFGISMRKKEISRIVFHLYAFLSFMLEPQLELQYGVFLYLFFYSLFRQYPEPAGVTTELTRR